MKRRTASYATTVAALALTLSACATSSKTTTPQTVAVSPSSSAASTPAGSDSSPTGSPTTTDTSSPAAPTAKGEVVIGAADFSESALLAQMYAQLLTKAGYTTKLQTVGKRELYEPALEQSQIDVVPDYLATMAEFLNTKVNGDKAASTPIATSDAAATAAALRTIATPLGLTVLEPSKAIDANAFVVTKAFADAHHLKTLSDLGKSGLPVKLAATEECPTRTFCQKALTDKYGIKIVKTDPLGFGSPQTKQAVKSGKDDLGLVGSTDGTLDALGLVILEDDKHIQLADNLVAIVGKKFAADADLAKALNALNAALTTSDLAGLEAKVDGERLKPEDVAKDYLKSKGLL